MTETLGDALPKEIKRVRDELIPLYKSIGPSGMFGVTMMEKDIEIAERAILEGDTVTMLRCHESLKGYHE